MMPALRNIRQVREEKQIICSIFFPDLFQVA